MVDQSKVYTVLSVLAGAYRGQRTNLKARRTHAGLDGDGGDPLCQSVLGDSLTEAGSTTVTCPRCLAAIKKLGLIHPTTGKVG
jgi:hypothetical protein